MGYVRVPKTKRFKGKPKARTVLVRDLRAGKIREWNQRRLENPKWLPDLSHMNFGGSDLKAINLSKLYLKNANFSGCNLMGADLVDSVVTFANFNGATLKNADLRGAKNLSKAQLESAKDASGLKYDTSAFTEPELKGEVPRVFLSYAWADQKAVLAVDQWLREKGARVIVDDRNFVFGESIREEILRWISEAGAITCFISSNSKDRPYPRLEREIAETLRMEGKTRVIYFCLDETILDVLQKGRLYIPAYSLQFDEACEKLWSGITASVRPARAINLNDFRSAGLNWTKSQTPK